MRQQLDDEGGKKCPLAKFQEDFPLLILNYLTPSVKHPISWYSDLQDDQGFGVEALVIARIFISPYCPDHRWGPRSHLSYPKGIGASFFKGKTAEA
jgi:hypothetical protein